MAPLAEYRRKRDPTATPEPFTDTKGGGDKPIFVVQRHDASRLHYDFRLERDGVLASWALPKGVPLQLGQRHLAVHVEDHPLGYASFEGEIPTGQYGAGTVEVWDHGWYRLLDENPNQSLVVELHGQRLQGRWALVAAGLSGDAKNWLIIRQRDSAPDHDTAQRYTPMLATLASSLPTGPEWQFEVKWDGYRAITYVDDGQARMFSRNGLDLTQRFGFIASQIAPAVKKRDCVLDGEVCALDDQGRSSFSAMQQARPDTTYIYYVFDLLELASKSLIDAPMHERRDQLQRLLGKRNESVAFSTAFTDGEALLRSARELGLEGVLAKNVESRYVPGKRTRYWLKVKTGQRQEFLIAGYTRGQGARTRLGALILAVRNDDGELVYVGNCGTGFAHKTIDDLLHRLRPLQRAESPFPVPLKMARVRRGDIVWIEPVLVAEVAFAGWTHEGRLRAPTFQGLRIDKPPSEVHREAPQDTVPSEVNSEASETTLPSELRRGQRVVRFSNLDKPFWPERGITKGDLLRYYHIVAPVLVPHLRGRPFTLNRYPDGWRGSHFFQKDAPSSMPEWIKRVPLRVNSRQQGRPRTIQMPIVDDELGLLWMINMGCIDCNTWYSRVDRLDRPDWVVFDLDPSPGVGMPETVEVALLVRHVLDGLDLHAFAKTSGAKGIHILVPIQRRHTYHETRTLAAGVAQRIAKTHPKLVTTEWSKAKRHGVLIDANQNAQGKTTASVYSVRPKADAPVSTPLRWEEVGSGLAPESFTIETLPERITRYGDLFADVLTMKQPLGAALRALQQ